MKIMSKYHKYYRQGFTIMEVLVVLGIIGILATMVGPAMSRIVRHQRANRAATVITADLQNAQFGPSGGSDLADDARYRLIARAEPEMFVLNFKQT